MQSLDSTLGAFLLGCVISSIFYGITSLQTFFYFNNYALDRPLYRATVAILWVLDTVHTCFVVYLLYHYTISHPGTPYVPEWSSAALIIITNINDCIIRLVFLYRIWCLSGRSYIRVAPIGILVVCTAVIGMFYGIMMRTLAFDSINKIAWALYATLSGDVATDLLITCSLCVLFMRLRGGMKRTDTLLNILMVYTINSGLLTCIIAISILAAYATMPENYIFMGIFCVLAKASFNSLLATLNARSHLRNEPEGLSIRPTVDKTNTVPSFYPAIQNVWDRSEITVTSESVGIAV